MPLEHHVRIRRHVSELELAFLEWMTAVPARVPQEHRARLQLHRELTALTARLVDLTDPGTRALRGEGD
ncbi:MAG TPA: hypothetical protein VFS07_08290 [Gemmatimonadales bacterium]|jgi:hypothetical protein|nr:hypothetical protein [Gemmatimonadales bacterium]